MLPVRSPASFRDPSGHVFIADGRVFRTVGDAAVAAYEFVRTRGVLPRWIERGWVVDTREVPAANTVAGWENARYVLEHARVPFVSYPYEWPFAALKAAALLHLDLQIDALEHDVQLSDASAYNVQFVGARPVFIDVLSFRPYRPGDYWAGHRQFCEQFLNPLLLRAVHGVPHNAWFRGALDGIRTAELNALLPLRRKLSWRVLSHVTLPALTDARLLRRGLVTLPSRPRRPLPKLAYAGLLDQLRQWIATLEPRHTRTLWRSYESFPSYTDDERAGKRAFIDSVVRAGRPGMLWDLGCNTGEYAEVALRAGAERVVGFDMDQGALDAAFQRAAQGLDLLPLYLDAANPSPDQGWNQHERSGLTARGPADATLALALVHHVAIGRNVPLDMLLDWITALAPTGVVEFVPKSDPMVQRMLAHRDDIFSDYTEEAFTNLLSARARILRSEAVSATGRRLFAFES